MKIKIRSGDNHDILTFKTWRNTCWKRKGKRVGMYASCQMLLMVGGVPNTQRHVNEDTLSGIGNTEETRRCCLIGSRTESTLSGASIKFLIIVTIIKRRERRTPSA